MTAELLEEEVSLAIVQNRAQEENKLWALEASVRGRQAVVSS